MSYNEQDVYRFPPSPSMTGETWRDAYYEKCAEVHRVRAYAKDDLDAKDSRIALLEKVAEAAKEYVDSRELIHSVAVDSSKYSILRAALRALPPPLAQRGDERRREEGK
jgi:hypothetical protein